MACAQKLGYTVVFQKASPPKKNDRSPKILPKSPKIRGVEGHKKLGAKQNFQKIAKNCWVEGDMKIPASKKLPKSLSWRGHKIPAQAKTREIAKNRFFGGYIKIARQNWIGQDTLGRRLTAKITYWKAHHMSQSKSASEQEKHRPTKLPTEKPSREISKRARVFAWGTSRCTRSGPRHRSTNQLGHAVF
jgi:hypothetical protein